MKKLSIVILSYNTKDLLRGCLNSIRRVRGELEFEVLVVDNASSDGSADMVRKLFPWVLLIQNEHNLGFARGNNVAKDRVQGENVLFLNSDTEVYKGSLGRTIDFLGENPDTGVVTCKILLKRGGLDKDSRRSFPTPWVSLTHFTGMDKLFPRSSIFAKYWYGHISENITHEIDVAQGAFFLVRKRVLDEVGWYDEDYFLDGEDIDLCWKIKSKGYKIMYYPEASILHLKKASKKTNSKAQRIRFTLSGVDSMALFYKKRLWKNYPWIINVLVLSGISFIKIFRLIRALLS